MLYTRAKKIKRPVFVFLSGNKAFTWKNRQIKQAARALAVAGYHSVLFENSDTDSLMITENHSEIVENLIDAISQHHLFDQERIVLISADFNSRQVFRAMQKPAFMQMLRALVFLSPVADFNALVRFAYTGRVNHGNRWVSRPSSFRLRLLYLYNMLGKYLDDEIENLSRVLEKLLTGQRDEAFDLLKNLDPETKELVLAIFKGDVSSETVDSLLRLEKQSVTEMFFPEIPLSDVKTPLFVFQSIYDKDVDSGQSQNLFENLVSSSGVYLHYSDYFSSENYRPLLPNPVRWLKGIFRLALALYRVFANVYSTKNLPYNPTGEPLRFKC